MSVEARDERPHSQRQVEDQKRQAPQKPAVSILPDEGSDDGARQDAGETHGEGCAVQHVDQSIMPVVA